MRYIVFDAQTGRILQTQNTPGVDNELADLVGVLALDVDHDDTVGRYVTPDGLLFARPTFAPIPTAGTAPLTLDLSWRHPDAVVTIRNQDGDTMTVLDGSLTLEDAGFYRLTVDQPFPCYSPRVEITLDG